MKRVLLSLLVVAFAPTPDADADYIGTISRQGGYTLEIVALGTVTTSVTFLSVVKGRLEVDNLIAVTGNLPPTPVEVPRSAERGILLVDTQGGSAQVRINGGTPQEISVVTEARAVFDITD